MLLDAIIEAISDLSTVAAHAAVEFIADHSPIARDGWAMTIAVGVPAVIIAVLWWLALTLLF